MKTSSKRVLIIVPAFNEAESLPALIPKVRAAMPSADLLVIDDGSADATREVARAAGAWVARHPVNLGYGAAIQTGYKFGVRHEHDVILQIDADGQHEPASMQRLLDTLLEGGHDLVLGSRFLEGAREYKAPFVRKLGMNLFGSISGMILGRKVSDPTTGFQALSRDLFRFYAEGRFFPPDYPDADVLIRVGLAGFRVTEIPVTMYEKDGASIHSGLKPIYYVLKMFLSILILLTTTRRTTREVS